MEQDFNQAPQQDAGGKNTRAIIALVLGILGIVFCQCCAPVAIYLGWAELQAIKQKLAPESNRGFAMAGLILGIIGTALLVVVVLLYLVFGAAMFAGALAGA